MSATAPSTRRSRIGQTLAHPRQLLASLPDTATIVARLPRIRRKVLIRIWWAMVIGWIIYTGPMAHADDAIEVSGPGGLFFIPDLGEGGEHLFWEKYIGFEHYKIDTDAGWTSPLESTLGAVAGGLMLGIVVLGGSCAAVTTWLISMTSVDGMANAVADVMGASAEGTMGWLFPSTLILGGLVAWFTRDGGGEGVVGNLLWLVVTASLLIGLATVPKDLVNGIDSVRTAGADVVSSMSSGATVDGTTPIAYENPTDDKLAGTTSDIAVRKNVDAMWRTIVVTPWCLAELGSIKACEVYGTEVITKTGDKRKDAVDNVKDAQNGSSTAKWVEGKDTQYAIGRVVILLLGLVVAFLFFAFVAFAALATTFALVMSYLLLIVGPLFICAACIPGAPRAWGLAWGRQLVSQVAMSIIAMTLFAAALSIIAVMFKVTGTAGWLLSALVTLTVLVAVVVLRGRLEAIFGVQGGGSGISKALMLNRVMNMVGGRGGRGARAARAAGSATKGGRAAANSGARSSGNQAPTARQPRKDNAPSGSSSSGTHARPQKDRSQNYDRTARRGSARTDAGAKRPQRPSRQPGRHARDDAPARHQSRTDGQRQGTSNSAHSSRPQPTGDSAARAPRAGTPGGDRRPAPPTRGSDPRSAQQAPRGGAAAPRPEAPARQGAGSRTDESAQRPEAAGTNRARAGRPADQGRRSQARVRYTRPDLPDAPPRRRMEHRPERQSRRVFRTRQRNR